jgi:hypothetical protein
MTLVFSSSVNTKVGELGSNGTPTFSYGSAKSTYVSLRNQYLVVRAGGVIAALVTVSCVEFPAFDSTCGSPFLLLSEEEHDGNRW